MTQKWKDEQTKKTTESEGEEVQSQEEEPKSEEELAGAAAPALKMKSIIPRKKE